jgi:type II secretory pathway pseudopilin PulG
MPKRNTLTDEQIERRRSIDRTAQRNARAKTKARIRELERLVDSLQSSQGDERLQNVMMMLEQQQDEARKLKGTLEAVRKLVGENITLSPGLLPETGSDNDDAKLYPGPRSIGSSDTLHDPTTNVPLNPTQRFHGGGSPVQLDLPDGSRQSGFPVKLPTWKSVNNALERAVEYLRQEAQISQSTDIDIPIRAIVEGWTAAKLSRPLDLGWLILKQIDQHVFCDCSPATRLAILRAMRLNMLVSLGLLNDMILQLTSA